MALLSLIAKPAFVQATQAVTVGYHSQITMRVPGTVTAYSLDSKCVEASSSAEIVTIFGSGVCDTQVVIVTDQGTQTILVHVAPPPPSYPPGFVPPERTTTGEFSELESRYLSDPGLVENIFDSVSRHGQRTIQMHIAGVSYFSPSSTQSRISLPSLFYDVSTPKVEVTLFDQAVHTSPLTLGSAIVRGFHLRAGRWVFHAGYSSIAAFETVLIPLQREGTLGLSYRLPVGSHGSLTGSAYSIQKSNTGTAATPGQVFSLAYRYSPSDRFRLLAELGYSHGMGFATEVDSSRPGSQFSAQFRYEPEQFANLGINNLHGIFSRAMWNREVSSKFSFDLGLVQDKYMLKDFRQSDINSTAHINYRPVRHWTLFGGGGYARFQADSGSFPNISSVNFPAGVSFDTFHFGSGFQYQYSRNGATNLGGRELRASVRGGGRWLYVSGYFDHQSQTPTLNYVLQQVPELQQAMTESDVSSTSPGQLVALLQRAAALENMGVLNGLQVNLSPMRTQWGGELTLAGNSFSHQRLQLSFLNDQVETLESSTSTEIGTLTYSRSLGPDNQVSASLSLFRATQAGAPPTTQPFAELTFRHRFHSAPPLLMPAQHGIIEGTVFLDNTAAGTLLAGAEPLGKVTVTLDGGRRTQTDAFGRYLFSRVSFGTHSVEVQFHSPKPFFYTTPSRVETGTNTEVNFGVAYSKARLFGYVYNDGGKGISGVRLDIACANQRFQAQTGGDGKFSVAGLEAGTCEVHIQPESLPAGYILDDLAGTKVEVSPELPTKVKLIVHVVRNIAGRVTTFDGASGRFVPLAGVRVTLRGQGAECRTDRNGNYLFRGLAPGSYTVVARHGEKEVIRVVELPAGPAFLKHIDIQILPEVHHQHANAGGEPDRAGPAVEVSRAGQRGGKI